MRLKGITFLFPVAITGLLCMLSLNGLAQQTKREKKKAINFFTEVQYSPGKVAPVYPHFPANVMSNSVEVQFGYETDGSKRWHELFAYPRLGVSFLYQNLGNNKILGQQFSIVPTVYFKTARKETAKVYAEIRYGLGLACFDKKFDTITYNYGVGSHFTWQVTLGANLVWNMSQYARLQIGGVWYHASNAHTQLPNVGVNNFAAYLGVVIFPFGRGPRLHTQDSIPLDKKWHANFRFGSGWQERGSAFGPVGGKKYPVYTAAIYASHMVAKVMMIKVGAIYRYYPMYYSFITDNNVFGKNQGLKSSAFILFTGFEFFLGHFAINLEAGVTVYKPAYKAFYNYYEKSNAFTYYTKQYIPTRFGANYYIFDPYVHPRNNVFVGAYVSANVGQAEFLELNVGYVF